jgi:hypothetical protein
MVSRIGTPTDALKLGAVVVPVLRADQAAADALGYAGALGRRLVVLQAAAEAPPGGFPDGVEMRQLPNTHPVHFVLAELDAIRRESDGEVITVVLPDESQTLLRQFVARPDLARLKLTLLGRRNVVAASCPGFLASHGGSPAGQARDHVAFVPLAALDAITVNALQYARALATEVVAIHVVPDIEERPRGQLDDLPDRFNRWATQLDGERPHLVVIESPYRAVVPPLLAYILQWQRAHPGPICTAVIPELVDDPVRTLWLHNHRAFWLKAALLREPKVCVADVTLHIDRDA